MHSKPVPTSAFARARQGALGGGVIGLCFLGIGALRALGALPSLLGHSHGPWADASPPEWKIGLLFAAIYCGAFALAGAALGAFWPMRRHFWGSVLLGYLSAGIVCISIGVMLWLDRPKDLQAIRFSTAIVTLIFGTLSARGIWRWDRN